MTPEHFDVLIVGAGLSGVGGACHLSIHCPGKTYAVLEMREATRQAITRARKERLPFFIEAKTYRFRGHSMADPARYRTKEEVQRWMERDPIQVLGRRIVTLGIANDEQLAALDEEAKEQVRDAVEFAEQSPFPAPESLYECVYA